MPNFMNVKESWFMYDTILVSPWVDLLPHPITGWFDTFVALSNADNITFFNSRNKSIGLAYNNQESRDQIPFALNAKSLSVTFFGPSTASMRTYREELDFPGRTDIVSAFWEYDLPQHTSAIFRVNQDERLKTNSMIIPPGYGPVGARMGQADLALQTETNAVLGGGFCGTENIGSQGRSHLKYRWRFPTAIGIPRRATLAVQLNFTEWARFALSQIWGPGLMQIWSYNVDPDTPADTATYKYLTFGVQVMITGDREVQQRGEYHA